MVRSESRQPGEIFEARSVSSVLNGSSELAPVDYDPFAGSTLSRVVPTTEPQREVWLADRLGREASLAYNESISLRFSGPLSTHALIGALQDLIQRHEALRSIISANGEELFISKHIILDVPVTDVSSTGAEHRDAAIASARQQAVETPFDLEQGPLFRAEILKLGTSDYVLILTAHHIVCDGWSFGVLVNDLGTLYKLRMGAAAKELDPAASFGDYAAVQSASAGSSENAEDEAYWLSRFSGAVPILDLPVDRARPAWRTFTSQREDYVLDADLLSDVRKAGSRNGAGLFATLLGGFAALLQRLTGSNDVVVGIPSAGQSTDGLVRLVGHCVNLLPLRIYVNPVVSPRDLIGTTQTTLLDALEHQRYTFGTLLKKLVLERDPSRLPLISVMFNLDQSLDANAAGFPSVLVDFASNPRSYENFELFVNAVQVKGSLRLECQYNADLFDGATVRRWLMCYEMLLRAICGSLDSPVGNVSLVSADDQIALVQWNNTSKSFSRNLAVHELIEAQASRAPDRIALTWQGVGLSYGALEARANRIAHSIRARGIGRGALVGLHVKRGPDMIAAMLAVLKSGAAYVPLDPSYPSDRLAFMAADAELALLLTEASLQPALAWPRARTLFLDSDNSHIAAQPGIRLARDGSSCGPEDPAYVIYTSGSTGKPKGVLVPHRAVVNFLETMARKPGLSEDDRLVAVTTLSFDIAVNELLLPLAVGAEIVLASREDVADGAALATLIKQSDATTMQATPATWRLLLEAGWRGDRRFNAFCGGEALNADLAQELLHKTGSLWNMYGPTETTVWSTCGHVTGIKSGISIGRPISNTSVWIFDEQRQVCPIGVPGEIWIGGAGVSLGYLNRPELTAERFVPDPFSESPGARLYRTGDRGRWRSDGELEHLGRLDFQVKVRGYRIELGEIEICLAKSPDVARAVVIAREDRPGDVRLVAYVVGQRGNLPEAGALKAFLKADLPDYMIPQHIVTLPSIPLLPNGKVDRKTLPLPDASAISAFDYVAPRTEIEKVVATQIEASLGMPGVSIDDDFFTLGGHSLLAAQLIARLNRRYKLHLAIRTLFVAPTVARLAAVIEAELNTTSSVRRKPIERLTDQRRAPLSHMQKRLWLLEELYPGRIVYNTPSAHRLHGVMNESAFERAFREMVRRQSSLRTSIERNGNSVMQRIHDDVPISLFPAEDLSAQAPQGRETTLLRRLDELVAETFDLTQAPLFKVQMFRLGDDEHVLFFMAHHIIWDGWSFDLFYDELAALYGAFSKGRASPLGELQISYGDFAAWHREWVKSAEFDKQLAFWRKRLDNMGKAKPFPTDKIRRLGMSGAGSTEWIRVAKPDADALHALAKQAGTTLFITLLAAYKVLLYSYSRQTNLVIGTPMRGRNSIELETIMGYFNTLVPVQLEIDPGERFSELVKRVKEAVIEISAHPDVPLEQLSRELSTWRGEGGSLLYQALFSFQDGRQRITQWGGLRNTRIGVFQHGATEDLGMWFLETSDGIEGGVTYNSDLFNSSTAQWLGERYLAILNDVIVDSSACVAALAGSDYRVGTHSTRPDVLPPPENARVDLRAPGSYVAPRTDFEISLATTWEKILGVERVGINDSFFELGGNSLRALNLVLEMEEATGIEIDLGEVFRSPTIAELVTSLGPDADKNASIVVPLQKEGNGVPIFCLCGINLYKEFAQSLGKGQRVFGVYVAEEQALVNRVIKGKAPEVSVERLTDAYCDAVARFHAHGPYRLAGLSFGGILAMEVASKLRKRGAEVDIVILLDTMLMHGVRRNWGKWFSDRVAQMTRRGEITRSIRRISAWFRRRSVTRGFPYIRRRAVSAPEVTAIKRLAFVQATNKWQANNLISDFKVILFRGSDRSSWGEQAEFDEDYGWRRYLGTQLTIVNVAGNHLSIMEPPNVADLGLKAQQYLNCDTKENNGFAASCDADSIQ